MVFSVEELIQQVRFASLGFPDTRTGINNRYSMEDIVLSAFSVFFTQAPSFLSFQRAMHEQTGRNNAESLFTVSAIPTDTHMRRLLDTIPPEKLFPVFMLCFSSVVARGGIQEFAGELGYLLALDGTGYFSSDTIHCKNCLTKTEKKTGKVSYYHSTITPVLVKPDNEHVFSLPPAFITPQDGAVKQDCEIKAVKRWLWEQGDYGRRLLATGSAVTVLGDDLYSKQPMIQAMLAQHFHYIFVCKRESHAWLYDYVDHLEETEGKQTAVTKEWTGMFHKTTTYTFTNHVPLKDTKDRLFVNWCEVEVRKEEDNSLLYHNAFITDHMITKDTIATIVDSGRARWKIENENNNVLKTKGYHFEHNYGHGEESLSLVLLTLILLAFLFHTILDLSNQSYHTLKEELKRQFFFNGIRELTQYFYVTSWSHLFLFMQTARRQRFVLPQVPFTKLPLAPP